MKNFLLITALVSINFIAFSQNRTLPKVDLKTLENTIINSSEFDNDGNPIVISFWATCANLVSKNYLP